MGALMLWNDGSSELRAHILKLYMAVWATASYSEIFSHRGLEQTEKPCQCLRPSERAHIASTVCAQE